MLRMLAGLVIALVGIIWLGLVAFVSRGSSFNPANLILPVVILVVGLAVLFWGAAQKKK
jgi:hypothetical protein